MSAGRAEVLVVEDDPSISDSLTILLESEGYEVSSAGDGDEALARLRGSASPSLILLDLMMPVMDGFEFRTRQLMDPDLAEIPVIVFSGGADIDSKVATLHVDACLTKPLDLDRLLELVASRAAKH